MHYTNHHDLPLSLALWLAHDPYVVNPDPMAYSATSILKPLRSIILSRRVPAAESIDVSSRISARLGQAIHDSVEATWNLEIERRRELMENLGLPDAVKQRIVLNPKPEEMMPGGAIPIYTEKSFSKQLDQYLITGTADFIANGQLEDFKTTKCYAYTKQSSANKFVQQGSIYRWIAPEIITSEHLEISYLFTDWMASKAQWDKKYPKNQIISQKYPLMSLEDTEFFIKEKINAIVKHDPLPQNQLPFCTQEELWQDDPVFKYYRNPAKTTKSTKNFDNAFAAHNHMNKIGEGIVKEIAGKAKFCKYCPANSICTQAEQLVAQDLLDL